MSSLLDSRRRRFLGAISAALTVFGLGRYANAFAAGTGRSDANELAWQAITLFTNRHSAGVVGRENLRQRP